MAEWWSAISEYEGLYEVSTFGRVRSVDRHVDTLSRQGNLYTRHFKGRILNQIKDEFGRLNVSLSNHGIVVRVRVSRLVAETFLPNPDLLPQVDHVDGNNNNNRVDNLRWADRSTNMRNKHKTRAKSKIVGVDFRRHCVNKPWRAQGTDRYGRPTHIGYFATKQEAATAYQAFRKDNF